jgi:hypothetical protein
MDRFRPDVAVILGFSPVAAGGFSYVTRQTNYFG